MHSSVSFFALSKLEAVKNESRKCRLSESATNRVPRGDFLVGSNCDGQPSQVSREGGIQDGRSEIIMGQVAYMRYGAEMRKIVERAGGRLLFAGRVDGLVIGEVEELWDAVAVVEYPSRAKFQELVMPPEMQAIGVHREAGLAGQLLILTTATAF